MDPQRSYEIAEEYARRNPPQVQPQQLADVIERIASSLHSLLPQSDDWCITAPIEVQDRDQPRERDEILVLGEDAVYFVAILDGIAEQITVDRSALDSFHLAAHDFTHVENSAQVLQRRWTFNFESGTKIAIESRLLTEVDQRQPDPVEPFGEAVARACGWSATTYPPAGTIS